MTMSATTCPPRIDSPVQLSNKFVVRITKTETVNNQQIQVIDEDAIESVFGNDDVKNCPVAIYSITGKLRTGKSFFLTLFMNYLKKKENWRLDTNAPISDGFSWRGGRTKHTEGIWVMKEPIKLKGHPKYEEVALYLMDTQGVFDSESSEYSDSLFVSLSTVLSSYQIYNVKEDLDRNELKNLKAYSDFGKDHFKTTQSNQTLLFLIRDWYSEDHPPGFEGGKKYITSFFYDKTASDENKELCGNIQKSFKDVKCVLLPEPSNSIRHRSEKAPCAKFNEVGKTFLDTLEEVFKTMVETLEVKELNGNPLCGTDIMNLAINLSRKEQEETLNAKILKETHAAAYLANLLGRCEDDYDKMAREVVREFVTGEAQLEDHHKSIVKEVLERCNLINQSDDQFKYCKKIIHDSLQQRKFLMYQKNELAKIGVEGLYRYLVEDCYGTCLDFFKAKYKDCLQRKQMLSDDEVENEFKITSEKILELFDRVPENEKFDEAIFNSYKDLLKEKLDLQMRVFVEENHFHQAKTYARSYKQLCEKLKSWYSDCNQQWLEAKFSKDEATKIVERIFDTKPTVPDQWWTNFTNRLKPNTETYADLTQQMLDIYHKGQTEAVKKKIKRVESKVRQLNKNESVEDIEKYEETMKWKNISTSITDKELLKSISDNCCSRMKLEILKAHEEKSSETYLSVVEKLVENFNSIHDHFAAHLMPKFLEEHTSQLSLMEKIEADVVGKLQEIKNPPVDLTDITTNLRRLQNAYRCQNPAFWTKQAQRTKTLFLHEYNEEMKWMLDRKTMVSDDIERHYEEKLCKFKAYIESNFQEKLAAKCCFELKNEMCILKCQWFDINSSHKAAFVKRFTKVDKVLQRTYWFFIYLGLDDVQDRVLMNTPRSWILPFHFSDVSTRFAKLRPLSSRKESNSLCIRHVADAYKNVATAPLIVADLYLRSRFPSNISQAGTSVPTFANPNDQEQADDSTT